MRTPVQNISTDAMSYNFNPNSEMELCVGQLTEVDINFVPIYEQCQYLHITVFCIDFNGHYSVWSPHT